MPVTTFSILSGETVVQKAIQASATPQTFNARLKFKKPPKKIEVWIRNSLSVNAPQIDVSIFAVRPEVSATPPAAAADRAIIGAALQKIGDGTTRGEFGSTENEILPLIMDIDIVHTVVTSTVTWEVWVIFSD